MLLRRCVVSTCRSEIPRGERGNRGSKGVKEKPVEVVAVSVARLVWAIHTVGIKLTLNDPLYPNVPDVAGAVKSRVEIDYPAGYCVFAIVEQLQSNAAGVTAENREMNSSSP